MTTITVQLDQKQLPTQRDAMAINPEKLNNPNKLNSLPINSYQPTKPKNQTKAKKREI